MEISTKKKKKTYADYPPLVCFEDIEAKEVDWLWRPYIPRSMITLIEGPPGIGKSWITFAIAAALSKGEALPGQGPLSPQRILIGSGEDAPEYSIKPRLEACGANMKNIFFIPNVIGLDDDGADQIEAYVNQTHAAVISIDPLQCYMGSKVDMHRANEVRPVMARMARIAERNKCAFIAVRHLRKGSDDNPGSGGINAGLGSIDIAAAARSILQIKQTKGGDRVLHHEKLNVGVNGPSLPYFLDGGDGGGGPGLRWGVPYNQSGDGDHTVSTKPLSLNDAKTWLKGYMEMLPLGEEQATSILSVGHARGFSSSTIQRAKNGIADPFRKEGVSYWRKLEHDDTQQFPTG